MLTEAPDAIKPILMAFKIRGDVIYILSGPPKTVIKEELDQLGYKEDIHYDYLFSMIDQAIEDGHEVWEKPEGHYWCDDKIWWTLKGKCCKKYSIGVLIDDSPEYEKHLPEFTKFLLTEKEDREPKIQIRRLE